MKKVTSRSQQVKVNSRQASRPTSRSKAIYRVRNWSAYNDALKRRGSLTVWISDKAIRHWRYEGPSQQGAQFYYSDLAIETVLALKAIYHLPLRQAEGFVASLIELMGLALEVPDYSTLSRRQATLEVILPVKARKEPLHVVVDSTGLKVFGEGEWKVRQHGYSKRRTWRKLHIGVDEQTGEILAETLTTNSLDDASQMRPLLSQVEQEIDAVSTDGAYDKEKVYETLAHPPGQTTPIHPIIPPRRNARIQQHGNNSKPPLPRDENLRAIRKHGRKQWKQESGYHRRSIAETAISRYKRILGPRLSARDFYRQQVETRTGCAALNRMTHLGRPQTYKVVVNC